MIVVAREKYGAERNAGTYRLDRQTAMEMIGHADTLEAGPWWHCLCIVCALFVNNRTFFDLKFLFFYFFQKKDLLDETRLCMKSTMNTYIQHLDTHEGTYDELRGDHVLADLADALANHEGQYITVMNAIQAEMGLLNTSASDEKKLQLKRRQRKSKIMKIKKMEVQPTTLFGYDDGPNKEAELARQKNR